MTANSIPISVPLALPERRTALALGTFAAFLASLFVAAPWSLAAAGGAFVLALSVLENEAFLYGVIFLIPVGWFAKIALPLGAGAARLDVATTARMLVAAGFLLGRMLRGELHMGWLVRHPLTKLSFLLLSVACASVFFGGFGLTYGALKAVVRLASYIGFYFFTALWVWDRARMQTVVRLILASTMFVAAFAIVQECVGDFTSLWLYLNPPEEWFLPMDGRTPSFLNYSNSLAGYLNLVIPFALALCLLESGRWRKLGAWTAGLGFLALACTQSTGGLVACGCAVALAILCFVRSMRKKMFLLLGLAALAGLFFAARETLDPAHVGETVSYDAATRFLLWGTAVEMFLHSPILGVGWGNFVELYGNYLSMFPFIPQGILGVHDIYLQFLAETGAVGFLTFVAFCGRAAWLSLLQLGRSLDPFEKALAFGVVGAVLTMLVHGFVDFLFQVSPQFGTLFWTLLALLVAATSVHHERHSDMPIGARSAG